MNSAMDAIPAQNCVSSRWHWSAAAAGNNRGRTAFTDRAVVPRGGFLFGLQTNIYSWYLSGCSGTIGQTQEVLAKPANRDHRWHHGRRIAVASHHEEVALLGTKDSAATANQQH